LTTNTQLDPLLRSAIVHFWFVTLHPFDDGNGRLTRALTDLALAQVDQQSIRLYAISAVILEKRSEYYQILELSQRSTMDITPWLCWFLQTLEATLQQALSNIQRTMLKKLFWQRFYELGLLPEQIKVLNRLLEGGETCFELGISASQYQKVAKVSKATASRHLADLVAKDCLVKLEGGGRNTRYQIKSITC
jgi:Fic family protein